MRHRLALRRIRVRNPIGRLSGTPVAIGRRGCIVHFPSPAPFVMTDPIRDDCEVVSRGQVETICSAMVLKSAKANHRLINVVRGGISYGVAVERFGTAGVVLSLLDGPESLVRLLGFTGLCERLNALL